VHNLILDCYRLAKFYGRDPDDFLRKPVSVIKRHMQWTILLQQKQTPPDESDGAF
jgi:hypothetical protein